MGVPNFTTIDPMVLELSLQNHYAMAGDGLDVKAFFPWFFRYVGRNDFWNSKDKVKYGDHVLYQTPHIVIVQWIHNFH